MLGIERENPQSVKKKAGSPGAPVKIFVFAVSL